VPCANACCRRPLSGTVVQLSSPPLMLALQLGLLGQGDATSLKLLQGLSGCMLPRSVGLWGLRCANTFGCGRYCLNLFTDTYARATADRFKQSNPRLLNSLFGASQRPSTSAHTCGEVTPHTYQLAPRTSQEALGTAAPFGIVYRSYPDELRG
jgi:hypothetical protein